MAAEVEEPVDQAALAGARADMAGGREASGDDVADETGVATAAGEAEPGRALNQDEIDSLLGFEDDPEDEEASCLHALVNSSLVSYERLPMLEVVFDRLVRSLSTSLRGLTSDNVEVSLENIRSVRYGDYLNSIPLPAMISVFRAEEWDAQGVLTVDSALIYSVVDVLLGGRRATSAMRVEGRPYTTIERNLVNRMVKIVLADMSSAFAPLSPITFNAKSLETNPRFAAIVRPSNAAVLIELRVEMEERGGRIEIVIPYGTLEPIRELLLQMFLGEKFGRDQIWETHLAHELRSTSIRVKAVLDEVMMPLSEVLAWKPGSQIVLNAAPDSPVNISSSGVPLFMGQMGRKNDRVAIRVEDRARSKDE